jgi:hypothetical protein
MVPSRGLDQAAFAVLYGVVLLDLTRLEQVPSL